MPPPVQVFHAQVTVVPVVTVLEAGLNALFVTEIPPLGGGVLPAGGPVVSPPPPPPPPHAVAEITASAIHTFHVFILLLRGRRTPSHGRRASESDQAALLSPAVNDRKTAVNYCLLKRFCAASRCATNAGTRNLRLRRGSS